MGGGAEGRAAVSRTHPKGERAACVNRSVCKLNPPDRTTPNIEGHTHTHTHSTYIAGEERAEPVTHCPSAP